MLVLVHHSPLELRTLMLAVATADEGSIRSVATLRGIAASAVSRRIRALEDVLGVSLFERRRNGLRMTPAGERFLTTVRHILSELETATSEARYAGIAASGRLVIGTYFSGSTGYFRDALVRFLRQHPHVRLTLVDGSRPDLLNAVREGRADIAILLASSSEAGLEQVALWQEAAVLGLPESHRLAPRTQIKWESLSAETFIVTRRGLGPEMRARIQDLLLFEHEAGFQIHDVNSDGLLNLVGTGLGITVLVKSITNGRYPGVVLRPIGHEGGPTIIDVAAYWDPKRDNPPLRRFLALLRQVRGLFHPALAGAEKQVSFRALSASGRRGSLGRSS